MSAISFSLPAWSQQKTGPGISGDDSLSWHGITLYGVIDLGLQYETHGQPYSDFRPAASGNIVQKTSRESVFGVTPSNMGQSRVGLQGNEPLYADWSAVFQVETFFNPQSGELADSLKSLAVNNGKTVAEQTNGLDGSSAGQALQTAYVGVKSARFGALTFGRQLTLVSEGTVKYDPNYDSNAFSLLGASNTYAGAGSSEDKRLDSMIKYSATFDELVHVGALYKTNGSSGSANTAFQADLGGAFAGASVDAYYSKIKDAITASSLTAAQVAKLPALGYSASNSLSATIADTTTFALMGLYQFDPLKFFAGYERIQYANPSTPLEAGYTDIGGYVLAFVTTNAYPNDKIVQVYWTGVRYTVIAPLDLTVAYYGYHQNSYGTGKEAGCSTAASNTCSGGLEAFSFNADYHFNKHVDAYLGAMYSGVHGGAASGYAFNTTNIDPTVGARFKF
jgi:predicted porin